MVNSINTNIAAYYAQQNIGVAAKLSALSVARLSSGNRIIQASNDIAALAIGTSLATGVSSLRTALTNAAQGSSLLQVADGALSQITNILQRQKAIASQAGSGSLSSTERAFLNQEFQALSSQIDQIAAQTNFNNVRLIDGSQAGATRFFTNDNDSDAAALASSSFVTLSASLPSTGDTLTVAGVTFTFTTADPGSVSAAGKISIGSSANNTALNIAAALNQAASTDGRLANLYFVASTNTVLARWTGGDGAGSVSVTVTSSFTSTNNTTANATINIASGTNGLGIDRTSVVGLVTGSIFVDTGTAAQQAGQALNLAAVEDNADFVGQFGHGEIGLITGTYSNATDTASFSLRVGDITYSTTSADITSAGNVITLTFTGADEFGAAKGGSFVIKLNGTNVPTFDSQVELNSLVQQINNGLSGVTIQQNRDVLGVANGGSVLSGGVQVGNTSDMQFDFRASDFTNVTISALSITAPTAGGTDAVFTAVINGELYRSVAGIGNQIGKNTVIALQNVNDSSKVFTITTGNTGMIDATSTTLDLATQSKADAIEAAIATALGIGAGASQGLSFQVGSASDDVIDVTIDDASTASLFGGVELDVLTQDSAATASAAVSAAISAVTAVRANVGALQSRFDFASANIATSLQNLDAARGELLDTDIASEATIYATQQVKLQAGISVLAQANQQLQSLLKLIG